MSEAYEAVVVSIGCEECRISAIPAWREGVGHPRGPVVRVLIPLCNRVGLSAFEVARYRVRRTMERLSCEITEFWSAGDDAMLICCAGPPTCLLQADACVEAANRGCPKCTRILIGEELPRA